MIMLTAAQIREVDRRCIEELGMPGAVLMNTAGAAVYEQIDRGPVGVVCGKGNNGGDGFVAARLALLAGFDTRVVLVASPEDIRGDAAVFMKVYQNMGGVVEAAGDAAAVEQAMQGLSDCAVLVDALLGTGTKGEVRGPIRAAIDAWPRVRTVSVDLPSGMHADTGAPCGACIRADVTVTFAFAKQGFANPASQALLGELIVADIGIPDWCGDDEAWEYHKPGD